MTIILKTPNSNGGYPPMQSWSKPTPPDGYAVWPDTLDTDDYYSYNGFVTPTVEPVEGVDTVTGYTPNVEAWEAWKESLPPAPEPEATDTEVLNTLLGVTE